MLATDVLIVGGGIAGSYLASLLPKDISRVIIDQKDPIKKDSCSGIVSQRIEDLLARNLLDKCKENKLESILVNIGQQTVKLDNNTYVLNRNRLNSSLLTKAETKGSQLLVGERVQGFKQSNPRSPLKLETSNRTIQSKLMIDCSGAGAFAHTQLQLKQNVRDYWSGTVRIEKEQTNTQETNYSRVFYDERYSNSHFAWILPREQEIEYGVIGQPAGLKQFLSDREVTVPSDKFRFDKLRLGQVETCADRVMLLGESACQNKPITGGGIIYGMICARYCSKAIKRALEENKFGQQYLKKLYENKWQQKIGNSIKLQLELTQLRERIDFSRTKLPNIKLETDYDLLF